VKSPDILDRTPAQPMSDITAIEPPDNTGSETFARYVYQALAAFPYCLQCAIDNGIQCIYPEHFEDLALQTSTRWRFIQIKTRDPKYGAWRLTHLVDTGGAFHSLLRTYRALGTLDYTLEAFLQGAVAYGDDLLCIEDRSAGDFERCRTRIRDGLHLGDDELDGFVDRLRLSHGLPARAALERANINLLGTTAPHLSFDEICAIHGRVIDAVVQAMMGADTSEVYPLAVTDATSVAEERLRLQVEAKRLTREILRPLFGPLTHVSRPLLRRLVDPSPTPPTVLEQKLLAAGAPATIVDDARSVRANATIRRLEVLAAGGADEDLDSVDEALRIRANAKVEVNRDRDRPAVHIWDELLTALSSQAASIDPSGLFGQMPELLLGEICDLADRCIVDFGIASDAV
jgi:hypothetical protein